MHIRELLAKTRRTRQQAMDNNNKKNNNATYVHPSSHTSYCS
jgi:hypothetical protein